MSFALLHKIKLPPSILYVSLTLAILAGGFLNPATGFCLLICSMITWLGGQYIVQAFLPRTQPSVLMYVLSFLTGFIVMDAGYLLARTFTLHPGVRFFLPLGLFFPFAAYTLMKSNSEPNGKSSVPGGPYILAIVLISIVLIIPAFQGAGRQTAAGLAYRAYFNGDFLKHIALIHEMTQEGFPPQNPFFTPETLHYYWFIYPYVAWMSQMPGLSLSVEPVFISFCWMIAALFLFCLWSVLPLEKISKQAAFILILLSCFALSYEGFILVCRFLAEHKPILPELGHFNIDGYSRWLFGHPQIDSLYRSFIYTPQHLLALIFILAGSSISDRVKGNRAIILESSFTGISIGISSFIGLLGSIALLMRISTRWTDLRRISAMVIPLLVWGGFYYASGSLVPGHAGLNTVIEGPWFRYPFIFLVNFGLWGVLGMAGIVLAYRRKHPGAEVFFDLGLVSLFCLIFVRLDGNPSDVGLKSALALTPVLLFGVMYVYDALSRWIRVLLYFSMLPASLTALLDIYNTMHVESTRYISFIPEPEIKACNFLSAKTPRDAVIQAYPDRDQTGYFSLIPSFAERRTALGDPMHSSIFQISRTALETRRALIKKMFSCQSSSTLIDIADHLDVSYILVGPPERAAMQEWQTILRDLPLVFRHTNTDIYAIGQAITVTPDKTGDAIRITNHEPLSHREILIQKKPSMDIFPGDSGWFSVAPSSAISVEMEPGDMVISIPRLSDLGTPEKMSLASGHLSHATAGNLIGWPGTPDGQIIQAVDEPAGVLWETTDMILPPGNYRVILYCHISQTSDQPSRLLIRSSFENQLLVQADLPDSTLDGFTLESVSSKFTVSRWKSTRWKIEYGGKGTVSLSHFKIEMIPVASELSASYSFPPASDE